jgi:hypothetical protein
MAIKSVTAENLAQFVATQQQLGVPMATPDVAVIDKPPPIVAGTETVSTAPDPGPQPDRKSEPKDEAKDDKPPRYWREQFDKQREMHKAETAEINEFAKSEFELRRQLQERNSQLEAQVKSVAPVPQDVRPDRNKYTAEQQEKYEDDLLAWNRRQAQREFREEAAETARQQRLAEMAERARERYSDFDEVISRQARVGGIIPPHVTAAVYESEAGAQLAYHLAKNPKEAERIFGLSPAKALLELGRLEQQYLAKPETPAKATDVKPTPVPTTRAPEPMPSITAGTGDVPVDLSKETDFRTYQRRRLDEQRKTQTKRYRGG